jgi:antitoxin component of RelBE/YafQ-DinJ toxin-antitoxin module
LKNDLLESKISFRVDDDTKAYIQNVADSENVTVSQFIRKLLFLNYQRRMRN